MPFGQLVAKHQDRASRVGEHGVRDGAEEEAVDGGMASDAHDDEVGINKVGFLDDLFGGRADGIVHFNVELRVAEQGAHGRKEAFGLFGVVILDRERLEARNHALRHGMLRKEDRDLRSGAEQVGAGGQKFNGAQAVFGAVNGNENVHSTSLSCASYLSWAGRPRARNVIPLSCLLLRVLSKKLRPMPAPPQRRSVKGRARNRSP